MGRRSSSREVDILNGRVLVHNAIIVFIFELEITKMEGASKWQRKYNMKRYQRFHQKWDKNTMSEWEPTGNMLQASLSTRTPPFMAPTQIPFFHISPPTVSCTGGFANRIGTRERDTAECQTVERSAHRADQDNDPRKGVGGLRARPHPCSCDTERRFPFEEGDHRWSPRTLPGVMYRLKVSS